MADRRDLVFDGITKRFETSQGEITVLDGVRLAVAPGETAAIVGPSGSGKSTLLNIAGSLEMPTSGSVKLGDIDISSLKGKPLAEFRASRVGFVFQDHHLLPQLTALENVLLPVVPVGGQTDETLSRAEALLERVGVSNRADAFPAKMSGGERQRVAIARALINGAKLILCDEPTGNLDRAAGENIVSLLLEIASEQGAAVLMVTHNTAHASRFGRCFELSDARLRPIDPSAEASK